ncbi:hypothetical protein J7L02_01315 [Candidatus Woesearchaeota archaeon]|nr:hypothetical protein [Candidatus Woesearchaeota archaeon]
MQSVEIKFEIPNLEHYCIKFKTWHELLLEKEKRRQHWFRQCFKQAKHSKPFTFSS